MTREGDDSSAALDPTMCALMVAGGPINTIGAILFSPPVPWVRDLFGLPQGHDLYLWILATWIFCFGLGYLHIGITARPERTFIALGAAGKATFALSLIAFAAIGQLPPRAIIVGLPDLALAAYFTRWLLTSRP